MSGYTHVHVLRLALQANCWKRSTIDRGEDFAGALLSATLNKSTLCVEKALLVSIRQHCVVVGGAG